MDEIYDAGTLAKAWLSVAQASGTDSDRPDLNRTVLVEHHAVGLRFVATDRRLLLTAFVPRVGLVDVIEPDAYVLPDENAIAMDLDGRGRGLLGYLLRVARKAEKDGAPAPRVSVSLNALDDDDAPTMPGLENRYLRIDYDAAERVQLDVYGGTYPDWRSIIRGREDAPLDEIVLNPEILGRLARAGKILDNTPAAWRFGGERQPAAVTLSAIDPHVHGLVMPMSTPDLP